MFPHAFLVVAEIPHGLHIDGRTHTYLSVFDPFADILNDGREIVSRNGNVGGRTIDDQLPAGSLSSSVHSKRAHCNATVGY
jgi:hypothetical protein